jgi:hypothetical protein
MTNSPAPGLDLNRLQRTAFLVGVVALAICAIGGIFLDPEQFFRAYLVAYLIALGVSLGGLVLVMLYHLTGGAWGYLIRHIVEASMRTLPLLVVLFVPVALGMDYLYPWVDSTDPALAHKAWYLSMPFFLVRTGIYFAVWIALAFILDAWSRQQDQAETAEVPRKLRMLSAPGLVLYGLAITFAGIDWVMSLQPHWYSTIFSVLFAVGQILSGLSFAIVMLVLLRRREPLARVIAPDTLNDLGNLLLTFVVLWTYMAFSQFMLIWVGNLPEEIVWYLPRTEGGWEYVAWAIMLFHFLVPFFLLLSRDLKRNPVTLGLLAGGLLFMQLVQLSWQILPAFPDTTLVDHWMDFVAPFGVGGIWLAFFVWQLQRRPLLPRHDPSRQEAVHLRERDREEARRQEATPHG